jgi:hypothetical protein
MAGSLRLSQRRYESSGQTEAAPVRMKNASVASVIWTTNGRLRSMTSRRKERKRGNKRVAAIERDAA